MTFHSPNFTVRNESFLCSHCGTLVTPLRTGCRNHCPACLHSMHLDIHPGDRSANCGGVMAPVRVEVHSKKGWMITHRCDRCGYETRNKAALDDPVQPDSMDAITEIARRAGWE